MIERDEQVLIYVNMNFLKYLGLTDNVHFGGHTAKLPQSSLSDFKRLLNLTGNFLDRMIYVCDWIIISFLEEENDAFSFLPSVHFADPSLRARKSL